MSLIDTARSAQRLGGKHFDLVLPSSDKPDASYSKRARKSRTACVVQAAGMQCAASTSAFLGARQACQSRCSSVAASRASVVRVEATAKRSRPSLEAVASFQTHGTDTGSAEVQTAFLSKRIDALTEHLKVHDTDYACQRGLRILLGQRTRLLRYVFDQDKTRYFNLVSALGIRRKKL
jgi:small subunit ribosomal protein S15